MFAARRGLCSYLYFLLALIASPSARAAEPRDASAINALIGRGINLGNMLEAPKEGEWGLMLKEEYFETIRRAGFDSVRIPIRWSAHAKDEAPYTIDPEFFARVDRAVDKALGTGLAVIVNVHHFGEMDAEPDKALPKLVALWRQIAERYKDRPDGLVFELLNEPHDKLTNDRWNQVIPQLLDVIRPGNPQRAVIVGPGMWNGVQELPKLKLPESDRMLIATFHYYQPFKFTHQGASWAKGSEAWLGTKWTGSPKEMADLRRDFDQAAKWGREHKRPIFLGEFGAYEKADMESRVRWTKAIEAEAKRHGFSTAYWEFASGFGAYDPRANEWREPLKDALLSKGPTK